MRNFNNIPISEKNYKRVEHPTKGWGDEYNGAFIINTRTGLCSVIVSNGGGWDHISVSLDKRMPTWSEMDYIKRLFFERHEAAIQIHPSEKNHININSYVLHLWRPNRWWQKIPLPPLDYI